MIIVYHYRYGIWTTVLMCIVRPLSLKHNATKGKKTFVLVCLSLFFVISIILILFVS